MQFWNPIYKRKKIDNLSLKTEIKNNKNEYIQNIKEWLFEEEQTPKDLARFLFPEDQKLTELAENAIAEGDINTLNQLFQKEISKFDELIKNAETQSEKDKIKERQEQQNRVMQMIKNNEMKKKNEEQERNQNTTMINKDDDNKDRPIDGNKETDDQLNDEGSENNNQNTNRNTDGNLC